MKAVFVSLYAATPHFETELELAGDLLAEGHEVLVLRCTGQLGSCQLNPSHRPGWCKLCVSKTERGLARIRSPRLRVETLEPSPVDPRLPQEFPDTQALKHYVLDGANLGRAACSSVCATINKDIRLDTHEHAAEIRRQLEAAFTVYSAVKKVLVRERPDRVYLFNGRFATMFPIVLAARELGIDFYTHERGATSAHYLLRHNRLPHDLDVAHDEILALWAAAGADREAIARRWYEGRRNGAEVAWLSFTKSQQTGLLPAGFDSTKHNIAVFNSTMEEYDSIEGRPDLVYEDEVVGFRRLAESLAARPDVHLYLRIHPNLKNIPRDDNYQLEAYAELELRIPNLTVIWPESVVHTYALMENSRVVLTYGSTMGAEAAFWGKPSVLAGRAFYERLDCCWAPSTHEEVLSRVLDPALAPRGGEGALMYGYWEAEKGIRYRRFTPTGLFSGHFDGAPIGPSLTARLTSAAYRILGR